MKLIHYTASNLYGRAETRTYLGVWEKVANTLSRLRSFCGPIYARRAGIDFKLSMGHLLCTVMRLHATCVKVPTIATLGLTLNVTNSETVAFSLRIKAFLRAMKLLM